jgi:hypothetical protein
MTSFARIVGIVLTLGALFLAPAPAAFAQGEPFCGPGATPRFSSGFADLKARLGPTMGDPTECEHNDSGSRDVIQHTTTGLAFWRQSTNTPTFTDGYRHWALTPNGLLAWEGQSIDPPANARGTSGPGPGASNPNSPGQRATGPNSREGGAATPPISAGRRLTPTTFTFRVLDDAPTTTGWPCQSQNPSCGREEWWAEWNDVQDSQPLQYRFLGPGLVTEGRFAEAINLLWVWPEGRELLQTAENHGVAIVSSPEIARRAFAAYRPANRTLMVNPQFTEVSTWLMADVLAHELRHASDHATNTRMDSTYTDCVSREQVAFQTEARFVRWLRDRQGGLPSPDEVSKLLSQEDFALFSDIYRTMTSDNLDAQVEEAYRPICSRMR